MMYTMPKNLLSICVNFTLATQLLDNTVLGVYTLSVNRTPSRRGGVQIGDAI